MRTLIAAEKFILFQHLSANAKDYTFEWPHDVLEKVNRNVSLEGGPITISNLITACKAVGVQLRTAIKRDLELHFETPPEAELRDDLNRLKGAVESLEEDSLDHDRRVGALEGHAQSMVNTVNANGTLLTETYQNVLRMNGNLEALWRLVCDKLGIEVPQERVSA